MAVPVLETGLQAGQGGNATSATVNKPVGTAENEIILVFVALDGTAGNPQISGFTRHISVEEGTVELAVFWKRAGASEPSTYTLTWTGSEKYCYTAIRISGVATTGNPVELGSPNTNSSSTATAFGFTTSNDDQLAFAAFAIDRDRIDGTTTITWTSGTKIHTASEGTATGCGLGSAEKDMATAGATGNASINFTSDGWAAQQFSLRSVQPATNQQYVDMNSMGEGLG